MSYDCDTCGGYGFVEDERGIRFCTASGCEAKTLAWLQERRRELLARAEFVARAEAYWGYLCLCGHARRAHGSANLGKGACGASTVEGRPICRCKDFYPYRPRASGDF